MSGPGGDEVGRVSIRVVPDTSGFRQKLQAAVEAAERDVEVTVPVNFDVDTAGLKAQLEALEKSKITIPVDIGDGTEIERLRTRLQALDNSQVTIPVELDLQGEARINAVLQRLRQRTMNLTVRMHGVNQAIRELTALDALVRRLDGRRININIDVDAAAAVAQLAALQAALATLRGNLGSLNVSAGSLGSSFGRTGRMIAYAVAIAALLPPLATALVVAGAAITAAWGFVSAAIAGVPAVLLGLVPAVAAVAIGMDGIKEAAKTLKPEFDRLKTAVDDTFKKGFTEAFNTIRPLMPIVQGGMVGIAKAVSEVVNHLARFLVTTRDIAVAGEQVGLLETMFNRIQGALLAIRPALEDILYSLMRVASLKILWDALTGAILRFGEALRASVDKLIATGAMQKALEGLGVVIGALGNAFVGLVENGLRVFANAWPGVAKFLDSLTGFFARFDWDKLGKSVSDVFDGLGRALDRIPQSTIDKIVAGFEKLGDTFQDPKFQDGLAGWADAIPPLLDGLNQLTMAFGEMGRNVGNFVESIRRVGQVLSGLSSILEGVGLAILTAGEAFLNPFMSKERMDAQFAEAKGAIEKGMADIGDAFTRPWPLIGRANEENWRALGGQSANAAERAIQQVAKGVEKDWRALGGQSANAAERAMEQAAKGAVKGLKGVTGKIEGALGAKGTAKGFAAVLNPHPHDLRRVKGSLETAMSDAISGLEKIVEDGFPDLEGPAADGLRGIETAINNSAAVLVAAMAAAMAQVVTAAQNGLIGLQTAFETATTGWALAVGVGMQQVMLTLQSALAQLGTIATQGMIDVQTAMTAGTVGWAQAVGTAMQQVMLVFTTSFAQLSTIATQGMISVQVAMTAGMAGWAQAVATAMQQVALALNDGFAVLAAVASLRMLEIQNVIVLGTQGWATAIALAMQQMAAVLTAGFARLVEIVTQGMALIRAAFLAGLLGWLAPFQLFGQQLATILQNAFALIHAVALIGLNALRILVETVWQAIVDYFSASIAEMERLAQGLWDFLTSAATAGMGAMLTTITVGMAASTAAVQTGMTAMTSAIRTGMTQSVAAVRTGVSQMVSALNAAVPQFRAAGVNMGAALAAGLRSQLGAVRAAAAALASAARAGVSAAARIASPSKVFIELGEMLGAGLAVGMNRSEADVAAAARSWVGTVADSVSGVQDAMAVDAWAADFSSRVDAELGANDGDPVVRELRALRGDADQSPLLAQLVAEMRGLRRDLAAARPGGVAAAQAARITAELGAF